MTTKNKRIEASDNSNRRLQFNYLADVDIEAAKDSAAQPTFSMVAYTGAIIRQWWGSVIVDLEGIETKQNIAILSNHYRGAIIGHSQQAIVANGVLRLAGMVSNYPDADRLKTPSAWTDGEKAAFEFVKLSRRKFPWEASIGADILKEEILKTAEDKATVNGREVSGPLTIARKSRILESSVVVNGADQDTETIAASAAMNQLEATAMKKFEEWLEARGLKADALSDGEKKVLKAVYDAEMKLEAEAATVPPPAPITEPAAPPPAPVQATADNPLAAELAEIKKTAASMKKMQREMDVRVKCVDHPAVAAAAVKAGWSDETIEAKLELAKIEKRSAYPFPAANVGAGRPELSEGMLEAALLINGNGTKGRYPEALVVAEYGADVATEARKLRIQGFRQLFGLMGQLQGVALPHNTDIVTFIKAAFSTLNLKSGVLSNTANKQLLNAYNNIDSTWRSLASTSNVTDFKAVTRYRLNANMTYEKIGPDGEIKHGEMGEDSYSQRIDTYAKMFGLTRQDFINDDLNALTELTRHLGQGAAFAQNVLFWALFLGSEAAGFFSTANGNLDAGGNTLGIAGLTAAELLFLAQTLPIADKVTEEQTTAVSHPLGIMPAKLGVPSALWTPARELMVSIKVNETTTADTPSPDANIYANAYEIVMSPYMQNAGFTGYSATAWYLAADPNVISGFDMAFLNGQQAPIVESADTRFDQLGMEFRGFTDLGAARGDPKAIVKMNP